MGVIEDVRTLFEDVRNVLHALENRIDSFEKQAARNHEEVITEIRRLVDYKSVVARLDALEQRQKESRQ